ncbi:MAG TPA: TIGR02270 family protein [Acetobacteraceae bacterium]|nr:TIGR02270 family protein [Acetobacteraceae bacterium]
MTVMTMTERQAEDGLFLWLLRRRQVGAPNVRLINLSRSDELLDAHLDALHVAGSGSADEAGNWLETREVGAIFVAASLGLLLSDAALFHRALAPVTAVDTAETGQSADPANVAFAEVLAALVRADRTAARPAIQQLARATEAGHQALAIAAIGARRSDPHNDLDSGKLSADSWLMRARACRTAGQLGRHDLMAQLRAGLTDPDPECRFWSAWAASRMGAGEEALGVLAEIAWTNQPRAVRALDLLLRRLELPHANAWLREFAKLPGRQRDLIRATGVVGDPVYVPWLIERMAVPETARLAGEAFSMITGLDLAYRDLDRKPPEDFVSGPNDDPADENVALDEDENLPWPNPERIGSWWLANLAHYRPGTAYFLGAPKPAADWLEALSDAFQRQRHAAALELAIRMPQAAMFEVRARGRLQRQLIARARGVA